MDPAQNFFSYHFGFAWPNFIKTRPAHISATLASFNILSLLANIFSPYKRLTSTQKTTLADRLSYDLISRGIGASVRLIFIASGLLVTALVIVFDFFAAIFYIIPIFSYPQYLEKQNNTISSADLENAAKFVNKIQKFNLFKMFFLFFEKDLEILFETFPDPKSLGFKPNQPPNEVISAIFTTWPTFLNYLQTKNIKPAEAKMLLDSLIAYLAKKPKAKLQPLGQMLLYGYTNTLDTYGTELTLSAHTKVTASHDLLESIQKTLIRPQNNNVLLVGEPGVGRHSTLNALASAISSGKLPNLADKRLISLDTIALLSSSKNAQEVRNNFQNLLLEAKHAGNIILAIDQIDKITTNQDNRMDLSEVLNNVLSDNSLPIIGISTIDDFNQYIRPNSSLLSLFEKISVEEPTRIECINILIGKAIEFYNQDKISTTLSAILEIIDKADSLIPDQKQPEKSILLLEDAISELKNNKATWNRSYVDVEIVDKVIALKTKTPVGKIQENEASKLEDLEKFLHKRIVGQEEAIIQISKAMRRARAQIEKTTKPMGSFLFLGPTGVGKTETAKALAEAYFGSENRMVRLDMSEFQDADSIKRLIGNAETKAPGRLASLVRENPFGLVLLDEFEKANHDVQNLFLQVLDEGNLTDAFGKKVSFKNSLIIATSNAGAEFIREELEKTSSTINHEPLTTKLIDFVLKQNLFTPELINRFDAVVVYKPLTKEEVVTVTELMLKRLGNELSDSKNIKLEITKELAQKVADQSYVAAFGARPVRRLIADKIEDEIAKLIISGKIKNGDTIPAATLLQFLS